MDTPPLPVWGLYSGPGTKAVMGAQAMRDVERVRVGHVLDFLPETSWDKLIACDWLLKAHAGTDFVFELSVPLVPRDGVSSLEAGAAGAYDEVWTTLANKLVLYGMADTVIRPGWEANGTWYPWSAVGKEQAYIDAFRHLVDAMRAVAPSLKFVWCQGNGGNPVLQENIWPGDEYVDYVGVDVYDYDWYWYPVRSQYTFEYARTQAWKNAVASSRGLNWFAAFARAHGKPLVLDEWGLAWRADGHGGGDNVAFVVRISDFCRANNVAWATYFNNADTSQVAHNITAPGHRFRSASVKALTLMRL